jgi:hypothetical protein
MKIAAILLAASVAASAQPVAAPTEHITVTAPKNASKKVIGHFVQSFTAPSTLTGKVARWENDVCPVTVDWHPSSPTLLPPGCGRLP